MTRRRRLHKSELISVQSFGLIKAAFDFLILKALPIYRLFSDRSKPPVSGKENVFSASAIILLASALDSHLCRLKFLHDVAEHKEAPRPGPPLPFDMDDSLMFKIEHLLPQPQVRKLKDELIEITVCRDVVAHPKIYIEQRSQDGIGNTKKVRWNLVPGIKLRQKHLDRMLKRSPITRRLHLNLVPTWINYVDAVTCILVIHRFMNVLEKRYGNPYAWIGPLLGDEEETKTLFYKWNFSESEPGHLYDWVEAFYDSLSQKDQKQIQRVFGKDLPEYLHKY